jgi:formylglycine-generating enzyme required for sulfatase activity
MTIPALTARKIGKRLFAAQVISSVTLFSTDAGPLFSVRRFPLFLENIEVPAYKAPQTGPNNAAMGPCSSEMAQIDGFCIDRHEAHLSVDGKPHPHNQRPPEGAKYVAVSAESNYPQAYVSREEAETACRNAGKRLCSLEEWMKACTGVRKSIYPYGNIEAPGKCNTRKPHLLTLFFKDEGPASWRYDAHFNSPDLNVQPGFLAKTGDYSECKSGYGVSDMVGNLHEWVSDNVSFAVQRFVQVVEPVRKKLGKNAGNGIFMGGFYSTGGEHGYGCHFITIGHEPTYHDYSTGFRCCRDAVQK